MKNKKAKCPRFDETLRQNLIEIFVLSSLKCPCCEEIGSMTDKETGEVVVSGVNFGIETPEDWEDAMQNRMDWLFQNKKCAVKMLKNTKWGGWKKTAKAVLASLTSCKHHEE